MNTTSGSESDDPLREARAYNNSIYLMVAMPYLLFGLISFGVYRGYRSNCKKAEAELRAHNPEITDQTPETLASPSTRFLPWKPSFWNR
jgi:hypothetical protein